MVLWMAEIAPISAGEKGMTKSMWLQAVFSANENDVRVYADRPTKSAV
jgi:hypothetical protein